MSEFAEQCVLGAAMLEPGDAARVANELTEEMFAPGMHRAVFRRVADLYWAGEAADAVRLSGEFPEGREYLVYLCECASVNTRVGDYIRAIQEDWQLKALEDGLLALTAGREETVAGKLEALEALLGQHRRLLAGRDAGGVTSFTEAFEAFSQWLRQREQPGVKSGFGRLDSATGGFLPGSVFTLAARPGGGKTDFALNLAMRAAKAGARVLYFSMEMTTLQLMQRVAAKLLKINGVRLRDRALTPEEERAAGALMEQIRQMDRLSFLDEAHVSPERVRHFVELYKPQLVFIDHIGLMKRPDMRDQYKALGLVSNGLKQLALEKKIALVQLAQMNRQVEARRDGKPALSDLRESGDLEQDSDFVGFLSPQTVEGRELYGEDAADVFLHLLKNRHGRTGRLQFKWQPQYHSYVEVEDRYGA